MSIICGQRAERMEGSVCAWRSSQLALRALEDTEEQDGQLPVYVAVEICAAGCALRFAVFW